MKLPKHTSRLPGSTPSTLGSVAGENQRAMRPEGFDFSKTANGLEFVVLKKRATKITRVDLKITRMKAVQ